MCKHVYLGHDNDEFDNKLDIDLYIHGRPDHN